MSVTVLMLSCNPVKLPIHALIKDFVGRKLRKSICYGFRFGLVDQSKGLIVGCKDFFGLLEGFFYIFIHIGRIFYTVY